MISILMPLYNGIEFMPESISSVMHQTHQHWEALVGINGHPRKSDVYKQAKQYESDRIHIFDFPEANGKADTLNSLVQKARYDILCLLDVDDKWAPHKLEKQVCLIDQYDVVGTDCRYFGEKEGNPKVHLGELMLEDFQSQNPIINSSAMLHIQDAHWKSKGRIDVEDYRLWLELVFKGRSFYNIPEVLTYHRIHKDSFFNPANTHLAETLRHDFFG